MKRYAISREYFRGVNGKLRFHYYGRTDDVEEAIEFYKGRLNSWVKKLTDENYPYRSEIVDCHGIRITDSETKKVIYEEVHYAEDYGWKRRNRLWDRI